MTTPAGEPPPASSADDPVRGTIYVLVPVHNRRALTERFVKCLRSQTDQGFHLVLVDDGSTDGTGELVRTLMPSATIIEGSGDWWWAGSIEQGRRWLARQPDAPADLVLIANDDTTFEPDFLEAGRAVMARRPKSLLLAQPFSAETHERLGVGVHVDWRHLSLRTTDDPAAINCFPTRGLFLGRRDFVELGRLHQVLLPHYLSDYELTIRAARKGYELRTDPAVRLMMDEKATGVRTSNLSSPAAYLRSVLSIRATKNPIYWTTFVLLASPRRYVPGNLLRVWKRFAAGLFHSVRPGSQTAA